MVCGKVEVDVALLKSVTEYSGCSSNDEHIRFFWQVMEEFTNEERSAMVRFTWGRSRLPLTAGDFSQRFKIQNMSKSPADSHLPESHTCFFALDLPRYSTIDIMREKLRYVIFNCTAIDGDDTNTGMQVAAMGWEE
jgi:E3 ubiquitin-protein ligase HERC2